MAALDDLLRALNDGPAVLVQVARVQGSGPREVGAWMAVLPASLIATIGGGQLEFEAISQAKALLADAALSLKLNPSLPRRFALGPSLGQCCGGVVDLTFERLPARPGALEQSALRQRLAVAADQLLQVALFGGGHVGRAIVRVLATLPARICWIDSRDEVFPADLPDNVRTEYSDPVQAAVQDLAPGSQVLIMSFSHAEDLDVVAACLLRQRLLGDLPYVGLIGSKSKWATFRQRLEARGFSALELAHITSPIGVAGIPGKQPEVIAVAVAAQLLQQPGWQRG